MVEEPDLLADAVANPQFEFVVPNCEPPATQRLRKRPDDCILVLACVRDEDVELPVLTASLLDEGMGDLGELWTSLSNRW